MACLEFAKKKNLKLSLTHMIFCQKTRHDRHTRQGSTIALCCVMTEVGGVGGGALNCKVFVSADRSTHAYSGRCPKV